MMKTHEQTLHNHSYINLSAFCSHSFSVALSITQLLSRSFSTITARRVRRWTV